MGMSTRDRDEDQSSEQRPHLLSEADPAPLNPSISGLSTLTSTMITSPSEQERTPLLRSPSRNNPRTWLGVAAPALLVPFVLSASLARGLTLAPRVDVYTELACHAVRPEHTVFTPSAFRATQPSYNISFTILENTTSYPSPAPSKECLDDPVVQSAAAELQTAMTTTTGILSAFTTGYWGTYGDKHGRTSVMAIIILGLIFQDLVFILVARYSKHLYGGHYFLIVGPIIEGVLGSWAAFNAAVNAYISDCSEPGSKSNVFARFAGLYFAGIAFGPAFGSFVLRKTGLGSLLLFYVGVAANVINLVYIWGSLPESLTAKARAGLRQMRDIKKIKRTGGTTGVNTDPNAQNEGYKASSAWRTRLRKMFKFLAPLGILAPKTNNLGSGRGGTSKWDFDLLLLGLALWCNYLVNGVFPNKYLYAEHMFGWGATELGDYITMVASARALWLVVLLPILIKTFKPRPPTSPPLQPTPSDDNSPPITPAERRLQLLPTIAFDLRVARISLLVDSISFIVTSLSTSPVGFTLSTSLSSFGGGMVPACHSLALALVDGGAEYNEGADGVGIGGMFGAISVLQAVGQNILGPLVFGAVYAGTVGTFPQMIFVLGAILLLACLIFLTFVTPHHKIPSTLHYKDSQLEEGSVPSNPSSKASERRRRGRSRTAKDLRRRSDAALHTGRESFRDGIAVSMRNGSAP